MTHRVGAADSRTAVDNTVTQGGAADSPAAVDNTDIHCGGI